MANSNFAAQVAAWVKDSKVAAEAIFHDAAQAVVEDMQKVGPSVASTKAAIAKGSRLGKGHRASKKAMGPVAAAGEGGHMPVDTGFLRASLLASSESMPQMSDAAPKEGALHPYDAGPVNLVIDNTPLGGKVYVGYTANYAAAVNYGATRMKSMSHWGMVAVQTSAPARLFVELAAQKWEIFVKAAEQKLASRLGR